jgi:OmpA-OmpF porin, OOP family
MQPYRSIRRSLLAVVTLTLALAAPLVAQDNIAAARLIANGVGPLAPVASNAAEEGRAKNRRVELVAQ